MNIQRYDLEPGSESMQRFPDGDYVLHTDHLEAVKQARADALRWALERLEPRKQSHCDCESCYRFNSGYNACMDDVRAIIEKEIEK